MATVSALIPRLQRKAVAVPSMMAELELRDTVRRFCVTTQVWRHQIVAEAGVARGTIYLLANPTSGDYITLDDGTNAAATFTFGTTVTIGASEIATMANLVVAINAASSLEITASATSPASNVCTLANDEADAAGNVEIDYSGANILVEGMSSRYFPVSLSGLVSSITTAPWASEVLEVSVNGSVLSPLRYEFRYSDQMLILENEVQAFDAADSLKVDVVVEPALTGSDYPTWLVGERYADAIVGGALYELCRTPGRPYTNLQAAASYKIDYDRGICRARRDRDELHTTRGGSFVMNSENPGGLQG